MIKSSQKWRAEEMKERGLITWVCKSGEGINSIVSKISKKQVLKPNPFLKACSTVTMAELKQVVDMWLAEFMKLDAKQLRLMQKLVDAQKTKLAMF